MGDEQLRGQSSVQNTIVRDQLMYDYGLHFFSSRQSYTGEILNILDPFLLRDGLLD